MNIQCEAYSVNDKIEIGAGYYLGLKLQDDELALIKSFVYKQWIENIKQISPEHLEQFSDAGMAQYHELSHLIAHETVWPKAVRILPKEAVDIIRTMPFIKKLEEVYGSFQVSDEESVGREEFYWRLVRPNEVLDIGPLHADAWFWDLGHGITPSGCKRVKVWIPLLCEPGANGLKILPGSHTQDWKYHGVEKHGFIKPQIDEDESALSAELAYTEPGNAVVFHDKLLHGGALNQGKYTRVSLEFTMFIKS
jgi:hypothetical protein